MSKKALCMRETRKYIKKVAPMFIEAFKIGYSDGEAGRVQNIPQFDEVAEGCQCAALLFASEMYKSGYAAGKGG